MKVSAFESVCKYSCIVFAPLTHDKCLDNPKYQNMSKKQRAQFGYYQRKKHYDALGFKAITEYSSFRSNVYKWRASMEEHLKQRDDLEIQLAQAVQVGGNTFKKHVHTFRDYLASYTFMSTQKHCRSVKAGRSNCSWRKN